MCQVTIIPATGGLCVINFHLNRVNFNYVSLVEWLFWKSGHGVLCLFVKQVPI